MLAFHPAYKRHVWRRQRPGAAHRSYRSFQPRLCLLALVPQKSLRLPLQPLPLVVHRHDCLKQCKAQSRPFLLVQSLKHNLPCFFSSPIGQRMSLPVGLCCAESHVAL